MQEPWQGELPIYLQLRERIVAMILDGELRAGDAIPSVRQIAADYRINPLTVTKAYEGLSEDNIVEKRRGLGLFVTEGAREQLQHKLRDQFLQDEWPRVVKRIQQLGLSADDLLRDTLTQEA
jgi:GntR family transcriptional regulator